MITIYIQQRPKKKHYEILLSGGGSVFYTSKKKALHGAKSPAARYIHYCDKYGNYLHSVNF